MNRNRRRATPSSFLVLAAAVLSLLAVPATAQCKHLAVVVHRGNGTESLTVSQLRRLMIGDVRTWPDNKTVVLVTPEPESSDFKCLLAGVIRMTESEYRRHLAGVEFRGEQPPEIHIFQSSNAASKLVGATPGALAIIEIEAAQSLGASVRVLKIGGKQPNEPGYPL